ncbi:TrbC/VirB2 family protein [Xanthomonas campestris pv. campestris]|uniref:TrbC/VirB2 family protein n=1 Tax=Xanthomonas campestris TaxID=339 RepID=UPI002AD4A7C1|nr:TrbC/VirB2 family protein [Xanthomonas campestris]MEB1118960.1 TrbC/VirB2 family protein [Xanthomonas campestris pv. campestris]MEB1229092.1 TrbC/VirB2 family protein [Xanthomonas campestris pv. campestris]MEB1328653.1 TrbC/VirB2 family protein [Xanthomonas campestris pv. campestris]MEB2200266.1 TrbC/VirB2 family protein [Xanthomonas campestris pv. campestris]
MTMKLRNTRTLQLLTLAVLLVPAAAYAGGTGMPWEGWLDKILNSISGPVAKAIGVIAIISCGLGIAFSEGGSGMRKLMMVCVGLSIAFTASTFFLNFLGYGGGAVF